MKKQCKECNRIKEDTEFYGIQGECKVCTRKRVRIRECELAKDPEWVKLEKERHRNKYHRLGYKDKHKPTYEIKKDQVRRYKEKYPEKLEAKNKCSHLSKKGFHMHHWSYNPEHRKNIIYLTMEQHYTAHRFMIYDQERRMYRALDGTLLDTKILHEEYISRCLRNEGIEY